MNETNNARPPYTPPFFMDLWREHRFRVELVASRSGVPENTLYTMLSYQPVKPEEAQKVLATLSTLYHQEYTLETVSVRLNQGIICEKSM